MSLGKRSKNRVVLSAALLLFVFAILLFPTGLQQSYAYIRIESGVVPIDAYFWQNGIALNSHTNKIYLVNNADSIEVYDGSHFGYMRTISESYYPHVVAANPATDMIYVSHPCYCDGGDTISVIDGKSDQIIKTITAVMHSGVLINQATNKIYVANGSAIAVIDGSTNTLSDTRFFDLGDNEFVGLMDINPITNIAYGITEKKALVALDLDTLTLTRTNIILETSRYENATDNYIRKMIVNPNTNILYILYPR